MPRSLPPAPDLCCRLFRLDWKMFSAAIAPSLLASRLSGGSLRVKLNFVKGSFPSCSRRRWLWRAVVPSAARIVRGGPARRLRSGGADSSAGERRGLSSRRSRSICLSVHPERAIKPPQNGFPPPLFGTFWPSSLPENGQSFAPPTRSLSESVILSVDPSYPARARARPLASQGE